MQNQAHRRSLELGPPVFAVIERGVRREVRQRLPSNDATRLRIGSLVDHAITLKLYCI